MAWLAAVKSVLGGGGVGTLATDIRQAIKGKELDPQKLIEYQTQINQLEAQHRSLFVAGWRPFIGWVCGIALLYNFIIRDILIFIQPAWVDLPPMQMGELMTVLLGLLGLGGLRTYEKLKGKTQ